MGNTSARVALAPFRLNRFCDFLAPFCWFLRVLQTDGALVEGGICAQEAPAGYLVTERHPSTKLIAHYCVTHIKTAVLTSTV